METAEKTKTAKTTKKVVKRNIEAIPSNKKVSKKVIIKKEKEAPKKVWNFLKKKSVSKQKTKPIPKKTVKVDFEVGEKVKFTDMRGKTFIGEVLKTGKDSIGEYVKILYKGKKHYRLPSRVSKVS